jgi:hypothetical protein
MPGCILRWALRDPDGNSAISLNLCGRNIRPKDRREIAVALYEQYQWGYGCISRAIGDNNKSSVQWWITEYKRKKGEDSASGDDDRETEIGRICGTFKRGIKKIQAFYGVSRLLGAGISEADADELREIVRSLREIIDGQGRW